MVGWLYLFTMFLAKLLDNMLGTAKTILVQKDKYVFAGIALGASTFIYLCITKKIITTDSMAAIIVVSVASGLGCTLAGFVNGRFSKEKTYINIIMSDDIEEMKKLRDFLAVHKMTNLAGDSYTMDWKTKTISITAFAETKAQSKLLDTYLLNNPTKFKRMVNGNKVKDKQKRVKRR